MASLCLCACDLPYYWQAAHGQWDLIQRKQPIDTILQDETIADTTKDSLRYLLKARHFALTRLQLDDNQSYLDYVDLHRDYVSWNVFATPELSMQNHTWCYPIAGCVSYRGYFSEQEALRYAEQLQQEGYDTYVGGVGAYSTLGWFDDPVLSTFLQRGPLSLAALLFHELAHQVLYVKDDTVFNESFATSIEQLLLQEWVRQEGLHNLWKPYAQARQRQDEFVNLIMEHKQRRTDLYVSPLSGGDKRRQKQVLIQTLQQDYATLKARWDSYSGYDEWFALELNNAQLSTVAAYHELLPGFLALHAKTDQNLASFIAECRALSSLSKEQRHHRLNQLAQSNIVYTEK